MKYFLTFLFVLISAVPLAAQAAPVDFFGPIFPDACKCEDVQEIEGKSVSTAPGWGCVLQVVQNVIRFAISIGIVLATLALVYAGFVWMTSGANPGRREQGRTMLINVFVGLFVMLSAWLIVDFVMKSLYSEETGFGPWNSILAGTGADQCLIAKNPKAITQGTVGIVFGEPGGSAGGDGTGVRNPGAMTDSQAREALSAGGVAIHNWNATRSLANTRIDTIQQAVEVKKACNCSVLVTATTGGSHATGQYSHASGYKIDLDDNANLDRFLRSLRAGGSRSDGTRLYYDSCGNEYARESSHWDITVNQGVCRLGS